ncbi:MAG: flagellar basal body-associated FliL family protein [Novosphingobium sp.]
MSKDKSDREASPKKGKGIAVKLLAGLGLIAAGGGGAYGLAQAGLLPGEMVPKRDDHPRLLQKGEKDPYAPEAETGENGQAAADVEGDGGSAYRTRYFSFDDEFTSNLKASDALLQVSLAASTRRDGRVLIWLRKHELAIRSALLAVLADTPEDEVYTVQGKQHLQKRLTSAINKVLTDTEGFGGVDAVYFRTLIIQ